MTSITGGDIFHECPTSGDVQSFLDRAIAQAGYGPRYIITDKGGQFWCDAFKRWCRRRGIRPRFGAVGKQGSIAAIERFIRSMKTECTRPIRVPLQLNAMRREIGFYARWYNLYRPNQALGGRTPWEVYAGSQPANARRRFEPRKNWPWSASCASPQTAMRGRRGTKLTLVVGYLEGKRHLPVVELRKAA